MILVIDDNPGFNRTLSRTLQRAGFEVRSAASAEQGLHCLCEADADGSPFELALIDYHLDDSRLDGIELARRARQCGIETKFVLISGEFSGLDADEVPHIPGVSLDDFEGFMPKGMLTTSIVEMVNRHTGQCLAIPLAPEIADAAAAAGLDVSPAPVAEVAPEPKSCDQKNEGPAAKGSGGGSGGVALDNRGG